jgi:hypothetical protein
VKRHRQDLQAGIEVFPNIRLDAHRCVSNQPAMDERQHRLGYPYSHGGGAQHPKSALIVMAYRPVNHGLGHERDRHRSNETRDRAQHHRDPSRPVRNQVGQ